MLSNDQKSKMRTQDGRPTRALRTQTARRRLGGIFRPIPACFLLVVTAAIAPPALVPNQRRNPYAFACSSQFFLGPEQVGGPEALQRHPAVISPNHKFELRLQGYEDQSPSPEPFGVGAGFFQVLSAGKPIATLRYYDISSNIELGWSPDSTQFFIMYSDGYALGDYHVHLLRIVGNHVVTSPATRVVLERFRSRHFCMPGGDDDNLFILSWTPDSRDVFLVAEVYPDTICGEQMGFYEGFLADAVSGRIVRRFDEKETAAIEESCRASGKLVIPKLHATASEPPNH